MTHKKELPVVTEKGKEKIIIEETITSESIESIEEIDNKIVDDYTVAKKLIQLKQSADSRGLEFSLSFKTIKKLLNTKICFYTGKKFTKDGLNNRTIDRVDSSKGYIEGNVVACTVYINSKKSNLTIEEIHTISDKVKQHFSKKKK